MSNIYLKRLVEFTEQPIGRTPFATTIPLTAGSDVVVTGASGVSIQVYDVSFQAEAGSDDVQIQLRNGVNPVWVRDLSKKTMLDALPITKGPWKLDVEQDFVFTKDADLLKDVNLEVTYEYVTD